jgi:hypothetical protein
MRRAGAAARALTTTLVLAVIGIVWVAAIDPPAAPRARRVGSPVTVARPAAPVSAHAMLRSADTLGLTATQRARLASLAAGWDRDVAPLQGELAEATEEFSRFAREAQRAGRATLADVRARTEHVQTLSAQVRERRARHAGEALALLTDSQRARVTAGQDTTGGPR